MVGRGGERWEGMVGRFCAKPGGFVSQGQYSGCPRTPRPQEQRDGREGKTPDSQEGLWLITCGGSECHEVVLVLSCFPNPSRWMAKVEMTLLG